MQLKQYINTECIHQGKFSRLLGISKGYLNDIIHGKKFPSFKLIMRIDEATRSKVSFKDWEFVVKEYKARHKLKEKELSDHS